MSDFLGRAVAFPFRANGRGGLALVEGADAVEDSIRAIIETLKGSHMFNPFLGLPSWVFQPIQDLQAIAVVVKESIVDGEDRVDPQRIEVDATIDDGGLL